MPGRGEVVWPVLLVPALAGSPRPPPQGTEEAPFLGLWCMMFAGFLGGEGLGLSAPLAGAGFGVPLRVGSCEAISAVGILISFCSAVRYEP